MLSLEQKFESINFSTQLVKANQFLTVGVSAGVNWWGDPSIRVEGYKGSVSVQDFADRLLKVGKEKSEADSFTLPERIAAVEIISKLKLIYAQIDYQKKVNEFAPSDKVLMWCQDHSPFNSTRLAIEEFGEMNFLSYSYKGFISQFGGQFISDAQIPGLKFHPDAEGEANNRIVARFSSIQQKYNEMSESQKNQMARNEIKLAKQSNQTEFYYILTPQLQPGV